MPIGKKMSIGQLLQSANPLAVYEAQSNYQKAQGKQNKTDRFAEGNYSALGGIGMAAKLLGGYLSGKHGKATDSAQADLIKAQFADYQEQTAMKEKRNTEAQAEKYRREDKVSSQKHLNAMELKASGQQGTSLERNLEAMGLQKGSPEFIQAMQQQLAKTNGTTVNVGDKQSPYQVGKIPEGYTLTQNAQGQPEFQKIAGSPQQEESRKDGMKNMRKTAGMFADHENINSVIDKSTQQAGLNTTGFLGSFMKNLPGSEAADLQANLKTIQADAAFSSLQNMRDNSKTGGALGQVSERELGLLSSAKAALEQSQSPEQFKENLLRYKKVRAESMQRVAEAYKQDNGVNPQGYEQPQETQQPTQTIVNPNTGERMKLVNGQWVKL